MTHRTAQVMDQAEGDRDAPDLMVMRETALIALTPDATPDALALAPDQVATLTATLRGHVEVLAPDVDRLLATLPKNSPQQFCARACVGEARGKLRAGPADSMEYARKLARVLVALCNHYEQMRDRDETPEAAALRHLSEHSASCRTCTAVDGQGVNVNAQCETGDLLYEEWRAARRSSRPH